MNIYKDISIENGVVVTHGIAPTVIKMPASTPRKLIELSARRIEAVHELDTAKKEVPQAEAELSACIAACEKLHEGISASFQRMSEKEERVRTEDDTGPTLAELAEEHKRLEAEYFANVGKLVAADRAFANAVSKVGKAEVNVRTAISDYINQDEIYRKQKHVEEVSTQEAKAYEARLNELKVQVERERIDASKKRLAELGVPCP